MNEEEVDDLRKKEKFTSEKLLFVFTVVVLIIGVVLIYHGSRIGSLEKESKEVIMLSNEIKTSLQQVQINIDAVAKLVNQSIGEENE